MEFEAFKALLGFFSVLTGGDLATFDKNQTKQVLLDEIEWSCKPIVWEKEELKRSVLEGIVRADCEFIGVGEGGYPQLDAYLHTRVKKEAKTVHSGPTEEVYQKLPSNHYDVSVMFQSSSGKGDKALIRQDVHLATDSATVYYFDSFSSKIDGSGKAEYLKKVDITSKIENGSEGRHHYLGTVRGRFMVEKPWFAPGGIFKREIRKVIEKNVDKIEKELIEDIARNI